MPTKAESWTAFLRDPNKVVEQLDRRDVILRRRDGESLRLSLDSRAASASSATQVLAGLLAGASVAPDVAKTLVSAMERLLPWVRLLPPSERERFVREFLETMEACAAVGATAPMDLLLEGWKSSAAIYAEDGLAEELKRPLPGTERRVLAPPRSGRR